MATRDSKSFMPDSQPEATGHKLELSEATELMVDALAGDEPGAMRIALSAHATALNSQATAMAASIAAPVYTRLGGLTSQIQQLAEIVTNARQADLGWRTEERDMRDTQSDRIYAELNILSAAVGDLARGLGKLEVDNEVLKEGQQIISGQVNTLAQEVQELRDSHKSQDDRFNAQIKEITHRLDQKRERFGRDELRIDEHDRQIAELRQIIADRQSQRVIEYEQLVNAIVARLKVDDDGHR